MSNQIANSVDILKKLKIEISRSNISANDKIYFSHYVDNALYELGYASIKWMLGK